MHVVMQQIPVYCCMVDCCFEYEQDVKTILESGNIPPETILGSKKIVSFLLIVNNH